MRPHSQTTIVKSDTYIQGETYTGTAYYVSNKGDDSNDGLSPETPFATMERLNKIQFSFGDAVFFERGSIWRKAQLPASIRETEGITLSAYGEGEKPKFYGSPENGGGFNTNGSYETIRNCYAHHCFQEGIALETFDDDTETCEYVTIEDNVVEYCPMGLLVINWDEERREEHLLENISVKNNYVMYSGFENYYNFPVMLPPTEEGADWDWGAAIGKLATDAYGAGGFGPDAHDGSYVSSGNTFAFAFSGLCRMYFYYEEYMNYLKGNTYAQIPGFSWFEIYNYGTYEYGGARKRILDAEEAMKWLHDENAAIITFD